MNNDIKINPDEMGKNIIPKLKETSKLLQEVYNTSSALKVPEQFLYKNEFNELTKKMESNKKECNDLLNKIERIINDFDKLTSSVCNEIDTIDKMFISKNFFKN